MPNRQIVDGQPYRYAYQGQEKDPETGKEAFQLRLWDGRIGRWLTTDPKKEFYSPYVGMGNMPIIAIDPDGGDIIILMDTGAVGGIGHSATLIGNDIDGWRYFSKNGAEGKAKPYARNYNPDLGDKIYKGKTVSDVIRQVNHNSNEKHNYDKYIRVVTTKDEDSKAIGAAYNEANSKMYGIFGTSCVDVPQEALNATGKKFKRSFESRIFGDIFPNDWFIDFGWNNNNREYSIVKKPKWTIEVEVIQGKYEE